MSARILLAALLALLCEAAPAAARDQFGRNDQVVVNPASSYIFYRTRLRAEVRFVRDVSAADRAAWESARATALERARRDHVRDLGLWQSREAQCRNSQELSCQNRERRPVEPTEDNFAFAPAEAGFVLAVGRGPQFTAEEPSYTYLIRVEPGAYVLYGQISAGTQGEVGSCVCMGTVKFEASAGRIVDLGELRFPRAEAGREDEPSFGPARLAAIEIVPANESMPVPARIAALPRAAADYRAAGPIPNFYFGVEIDRLPAIPGILAYERDRIIDVRAAGGATPP